jgi:hypothetical protein
MKTTQQIKANMNSLPFISHHLFVAAIGNEGRARRRPTRHERPSGRAPEPAIAIPLEVLDGRKPLPVGAIRPLRASVARAQN